MCILAYCVFSMYVLNSPHKKRKLTMSEYVSFSGFCLHFSHCLSRHYYR